MKMRITVEDMEGNIIADHIKTMTAKHEGARRRVQSRWLNQYQDRHWKDWKRISIEPIESDEVAA